MDFTILEHFGLLPNDIKVYRGLLEIGQTKTGYVIRRTGSSSSSVYESLSRLIKKGLVSFQVKNNIRYYRAELPEVLIDQMMSLNDDLRALSRQIEKIQTQPTSRSLNDTFEGTHGFMRGFLRHIASCEHGEEIQIVSFSPRLTHFRELRTFFNMLDHKVIAKKIQIRMLLDRTLQASFGKDKKKIGNYDLRYLPAGYFNPSAVNISKREVLLSVWGKHPMVFAIHHEAVIQSFLQNFEFLWKMAK